MWTDPAMHNLMSRRRALRAAACGFGHTALLGLLADEVPAKAADHLNSARHTRTPLDRRLPHHPPRATRVIFLFMHGGVSHVDSFDPKPKLDQLNGQPSPIRKPEFNFAATGKLLRSPWKFRRYGHSGIPVSDLFPQIGSCIDDIAVIRSMRGNQVAHGGASLQLHTGDGVAIRPSMGAWTLYGLGSENSNLPGFVTLSPSTYHGGVQNFGSAFMPASYQGTAIGDGRTAPRAAQMKNLTPPNSDFRQQRRQLDLLKQQNLKHLERSQHDTRLQARIEAFELAFRMQRSVPEVMNFSSETAETTKLYGIDQPASRAFGQQCLAARRLVERGVRFVQIQHGAGGAGSWDAHSGLKANHTKNALAVDQPIGGLLEDLDRRGMLDETLVIFASEFGRTPGSQSGNGRDHHIFGFSVWMAGGGLKRGVVHGATDEIGFHAVENRHYVTDVHATILHQLGLDSRQLEIPGRKRLDIDHGQPIHEIIA